MSIEPIILPSKPSSINQKEFVRRIDDFEKRWIETFEEIKSEQISKNDFDRLELELNSELSELGLIIVLRKVDGVKSHILENKLNAAKNRVLSYKEKARAISASRRATILQKSASTTQNFLTSIVLLITQLVDKIPKVKL